VFGEELVIWLSSAPAYPLMPSWNVTVTGTNWYRSVTVAVAEPPLSEPVSVAVLSLESMPVVRAKLPMDAPARTVTAAGVLTAPIAVMATAAPPVPAALFSVAVQVAVMFGPITAGAHVIDVTITGPVSDKTAVAEPPFKDAVSVALPSTAIIEELAVKVAVPDPAATVIVAGTVTSALLEERVTTAPVAGAACDRVSVQRLVAFEVNVVGAH
jgi:hypothetical protein